MTPCEDYIEGCTGLAGCGGRLCRNMRGFLSKMEFTRPAVNTFGEQDETVEPEKGKLCGFITRLRPPSDPSCAIPGIIGTASNVRLTVVASSRPLRVNDIIRVDDRFYCVQLQLSELPVRYSLVERSEIL